jgi:DNA end-binding protein Ku
MLALAEKLIEQKVTRFDPQNYEDRYETALMEMIREKLKGHKPIVAAAPERGNVVNLMDALKASLSQSKPPARSKGKGEPAVPMPKPAGRTVGVIEAEPEAAAAKPAKAPSKAAAAKAALAKSAAAKPKAPARKKA